MKFIARNLNLIGLFLLASFATAAAALYFQVPDRIQTARARASTPIVRYVCPMHANIISASPTNCPECGMKLVVIGGEKTDAATGAHKNSCCPEKPGVAEPSPAAMACPHLAAQATQAAQMPPADACCPKPANP